MGSTSLQGLHRFGELILHPATTPGQTAGRVRIAS